jgi:hypothetical protein
MPKKLHDKVNELLKNDSFYPEKSEKEREDLAWPIATNILKESSFNFKNYRIAQVAGQDLLKSDTIDEFVQKFGTFASTNPNKLIAFNEYLKSALFKGQKLSGYKGFRLFANFLNQNSNKNLTNEEMKVSLTNIEKTDSNNFVFNEELTKETETAKSDASVLDLQKQKPGITGDSVIQNLPGAQKVPGNSGATGIQNIIQYNSQSAARAPKTEEQIKASERMFMMDNMDALNILSRNIYDVNALRNFEKDLTFSKNHYGTRFEAPVTNMMNLYGSIINEKDPKVKNKLGAQIQSIIQNQLLGSGVKPSVVFDKINPVTRTEYLYSGKQAPTPYQFRYLEDVYNESKAELQKEFDQARIDYANDAGMTVEQMNEESFPIELKKAAGPGTPIHQRAWMEKNKKTVMEKLVNETVKGSPLKTTEGPGFDAPVGPPNTTGTTSTPSNSAYTSLNPKSADPQKIIDNNSLKGILTPPPASGEKKAAANRINKFNLFKHS